MALQGAPRDQGRPRPVRQAVEDEVLHRVEANPSTSVRHLASDVGTSTWAVHKVLKSHNLHPFKLIKVQDLSPEDFPRRLAFSNWVVEKVQEEPNFPSVVLFTDEKGFSREGTFNHQKSHHWAEQNPHAKHVRGYQRKFHINVWAGIVGDHLLGPYPLPARLNAENYLQFLRQVLPELLEANLPLPLFFNHWFQQDGCPAHYGLNVRAYLDQTYPNRWMGRGGPVPWPARSPDLTPLDFYLWGAMEAFVYETPVLTEQDLMARIVMAGEFIRTDPGVFLRVRTEWLRRCRKCVEVEGGHFQHLL